MAAFDIHCYIDMDGVLTDFHNSAMKLHNVPADTAFDRGSWDTVPRMCEAVGIGHITFWDRMGTDYWHSMPWLPGGREILEAAEKLFGFENVCILSSPANPASAHGKLRWLKEHMPRYLSKGQCYLGRNKAFAAGVTNLLVDDGDHNIEAFVAKGGLGLLVPTPFNSRHKEASNGWKQVISELPTSWSVLKTRQNKFKIL